MKFVVGLSILLLTYFCYQELSSSDVKALEQNELEALLKGDHKQAKALRSSFNKLLPEVRKQDLNQGPPELSSAEAIAQFGLIMEENEYDGMTYLRRALFSSDYTGEQKEEILEGALPQVSKEEVISLCRVIVARNSEPALYRRALIISTQELEDPAAEKYLRDLYLQSDYPELKQTVKDFATSKGFNF